MYQFSSGSAYGIDSTGVPRKFAELQDISVDVSFTTKSLYGQNQFALAIGRGQGKITGKAKYAGLRGAMINNLFFGQGNNMQTNIPIFGEAGSVPGVSTYTITVSQATSFVDDLGVTYASGANAGVPFTKVGSPTTAGQYSVNAATGVYTFSAADANAAVFIDYTYKVTTSGYSIPINQQLAGTTPAFGLVLVSKFTPPGTSIVKAFYLNLFLATSSKLSLATKMDDFMVPEFDFEAMANASGNIGTFALGD